MDSFSSRCTVHLQEKNRPLRRGGCRHTGSKTSLIVPSHTHTHLEAGIQGHQRSAMREKTQRGNQQFRSASLSEDVGHVVCVCDMTIRMCHLEGVKVLIAELKAIHVVR